MTLHASGYRAARSATPPAEYPPRWNPRDDAVSPRWINGLFPKILGERRDPELAAILVQLPDGGIAAARLGGGADAAPRARRTAERLGVTGRAASEHMIG
ncbi:hypothetical protein [Nocardia cyriacigeorgica]|uniref:hypothetical protein n=1 Tax=Nocardia cyriacigeorgica TaxID=135487 RepID=UPI001895BFAC|nr:hypothetical protein [Nocardia cyriacigeorgica]MBF6455265.1 hypothetical protein [Nocardia cyriacigeorgica]MBF6553993.1 hypothetical protein [Nocardia cyriacigeorgica]